MFNVTEICSLKSKELHQTYQASNSTQRL